MQVAIATHVRLVCGPVVTQVVPPLTEPSSKPLLLATKRSPEAAVVSSYWATIALSCAGSVETLCQKRPCAHISIDGVPVAPLVVIVPGQGVETAAFPVPPRQ